MAALQKKSVILDANVLINLLTADQLSVLLALDHYRFLVPNHVLDEVHRKAQRQRLRKALKAGWLEEVEIVDLTEMELYAEYRSRFGEGESACMAVARSRGWIVASDERAVRKEVAAKLGQENFLDSKSILNEAVGKGVLDHGKFETICKRLDL